MALTNEEREKFIGVINICSLTGNTYTGLTNYVHAAFEQGVEATAVHEQIKKSVSGRDCLKAVEDATGTPAIRADISAIKIKDEAQQNEIDALKIFDRNSELQASYLIAEVKKLTSQVIDYKTELDDARKQLYKVSATLDNVCHSREFNCEAIGKTAQFDPDIDGLGEIIK